MTRDWEKNSLRGAVEKDLGVLVEEKLDMSQPRKSTPSWAVSKEPWPTDQGGDSPFLSRESTAPSPGVLSTRMVLSWDSGSAGEHEDAQSWSSSGP